MVLIKLLARYVSGTPKAGSDAADVGWFTIDELDGLYMRSIVRDLVFNAMS